jgi:site-specific DNA-methyltransferase (adenine-specific)
MNKQIGKNREIMSEELIFKTENKINLKKQLYCIKNIELHNMDCLSGMDLIQDKSIDVVVTSPPYNLGIDYNNYNDCIPRDQYLDWIEDIIIKIKEKLNDNGSFFLNIGSKPTDPWVPFEVLNILKKHYNLQNVIHWIKSIYIENDSYDNMTSINVGHYKPINSMRFLNDTQEYIFHLTKNGNVQIDRLSIGIPYKDEGNINRWQNGKNNLRCRGNCWYIPYKTINSREKERPHPASYPPELAEMCILLHGIKKTKKVLDPFMGIGNTSLACKKLGISCIGFEIDKEYFTINIRLLENDI